MNVVPIELLQALVRRSSKAAVDPLSKTPTSKFELAVWIVKFSLDVQGPFPWEGGSKWIFGVCPWNEDHRDRSAWLGQRGNGAIAAGCLHNGCAGKNWYGLRDVVEPGWRQTRHGQPLMPAAGSQGWEAPNPFHEFDLPAFPTDSLPSWLRDFVEAEATATQTPVELAAMLTLTVIATVVAKKVKVRVNEGYSEPVNIFTVTTLPSGNRKSSVFRAIIKPLEDYEAAEAKRTAAQIAQATTAHKIKEGALKRLQEQAVQANGSKREQLTKEAAALSAELAESAVPIPVRYIADDCTPEKLSGLLRDHGGRIAIMSPEGDVFDLMGGRYSSDKGPNFGVFLKAHAGDAIRVDRMIRGGEFVQNPALTVGLAVQPEVIRGLADKPSFRGRGLLGRFLYALPKSRLGHRISNAPSVPTEVYAAYLDRITRLLSIPDQKSDTGELTPSELTISPDGAERLLNFDRRVELSLEEFGELGSMTDWGGKLVGAVIRIAGLLHMAVSGSEPEHWQLQIAAQTIERAIQIGTFLIHHAKAAYAEMGADEVVEKAKKILRWLQDKDMETFTRRDLHQAMRTAFKRVTDLDKPLDVLVQHNAIRKQSESTSTGAGRPSSPTYEVNPKLLSQNTHK